MESIAFEERALGMFILKVRNSQRANDYRVPNELVRIAKIYFPRVSDDVIKRKCLQANVSVPPASGSVRQAIYAPLAQAARQSCREARPPCNFFQGDIGSHYLNPFGKIGIPKCTPEPLPSIIATEMVAPVAILANSEEPARQVPSVSPTTIGKMGAGPSHELQNSSAQRRILLQDRLTFVRQLNEQGIKSLLKVVSPGNTQQNTLIQLVSILLTKPGNVSFSSDLKLHRIGCILEVLGHSLNYPQPAGIFLRFDILKQIEMVSRKTMPKHQRVLAFSIFGLYPVTPLNPDSRLPLFLPYIGNEKGKRAGNRYWKTTRRILENYFSSKDVQELRTTDPGTFLSYEILVGRVSPEFGHLGWMQSLWRSLFNFYHKKCMNILIEASKSQELDTDRPSQDQEFSLFNTEASLEVEWNSLTSMQNVSELSLLSIQMIKALIENSSPQLEIFESELLRYSKKDQYQEDMLNIMCLLFKYTESEKIVTRLIEIAEKTNIEEPYLSLLGNVDQMVKYYQGRNSIELSRIKNYNQTLRNMLAESYWKRNPTAIMELEGILFPTSMQVHVIEVLHELSFSQMAGALQYIQTAENFSGYRLMMDSQFFPLFIHLIKEWESLQRFMSTFPFTLDSARQIHVLLKSDHMALKCDKFSLKPPKFYQKWLVNMLEQIFSYATIDKYSAEAVQLSEEAFVSAMPYLKAVVQESVIVESIYPRLSEILCHDSSLIEELCRI